MLINWLLDTITLIAQSAQLGVHGYLLFVFGTDHHVYYNITLNET